MTYLQVHMQNILRTFGDNYDEPVTALTALYYHGYCADRECGHVELSANFNANSDNFIYIKSPLPAPEEYIRHSGFTLVGKNQALLDSFVYGMDLSRSDEAVIEFFYEGAEVLDSFVDYARKAGISEDKLNFYLEPALSLGYQVPERRG